MDNDLCGQQRSPKVRLVTTALHWLSDYRKTRVELRFQQHHSGCKGGNVKPVPYEELDIQTHGIVSIQFHELTIRISTNLIAADLSNS